VGSAHDECSTAQAWPAAAEDAGQSAAGESASHSETVGPIVDHRPFVHKAVSRQNVPRGSSPYSHRAPSVAQALVAAGHEDGHGGA
jgi:hypothetical protein